MLFWFMADLVLAFHITLFVVLAIGVVLAALGFMRHRRALNLVFWPTLVVALGWAMVPMDCGLTEVEIWLRHRVDPDWTRSQALIAQTVTKALIGVVPSLQFFLTLGALMSGLAIFGFWRTFWGQGMSSPSPG